MPDSQDHARVRTARLVLSRPSEDDVPALHAINADPRLWAHLPSGRDTSLQMTQARVARWQQSWEATGLGSWVVRVGDAPEVIGHCGCSLRADRFWNVGYRFAASAQGHGYATEAAQEGIRRARLIRPDLPVIAYLLEHNHASARVAERLGLELADRGPDAGNPDPQAIRLVYVDRPLDEAQLAAARA